jgi:hypothetical protein
MFQKSPAYAGVKIYNHLPVVILKGLKKALKLFA